MHKDIIKKLKVLLEILFQVGGALFELPLRGGGGAADAYAVAIGKPLFLNLLQALYLIGAAVVIAA